MFSWPFPFSFRFTVRFPFPFPLPFFVLLPSPSLFPFFLLFFSRVFPHAALMQSGSRRIGSSPTASRQTVFRQIRSRQITFPYCAPVASCDLPAVLVPKTGRAGAVSKSPSHIISPWYGSVCWWFGCPGLAEQELFENHLPIQYIVWFWSPRPAEQGLFVKITSSSS